MLKNNLIIYYIDFIILNYFNKQTSREILVECKGNVKGTKPQKSQYVIVVKNKCYNCVYKK